MTHPLADETGAVTFPSGVVVRSFTGLNNTPAAVLAVRGWLELVERGLGDGSLNMSYDLKAFVAYAANGRDQLPVGVMTWQFLEHCSEVLIHQSYVLPEFRGQGCYAALWECMVQRAAELKAVAIVSGTHVRNAPMRAIASRQGRVEVAVTLRYDLPR